MKAVLALCFLGAASAAVIPLTYNAGVIPYTGVVPQATGFLPINTGIIPQAGIIPQTYSVGTPALTTYQVSAVAPAPGYVAKTLGSEHVAPLPAGSTSFASHHINVAKAPGTE
ncbi:uncharacterized protein [Macrobrachium rosenbergii]|uniref:uncharacterized protein n=1 Tax=Macrobrachium rosenbergii TaxID=79674 RepID=UPI0034D58D75